jgi:predicted dehydrogenase
MLLSVIRMARIRRTADRTHRGLQGEDIMNPNRRLFLGALGAPLLYGAQSAEKLKVGLIGCGWWGGLDTNAALKTGTVSIVALADADSDHLNSFAAEMEQKQGSRPKTFKDYRELLDLPGLDAVIIATPPHWHALPFLAACRKGLHIYQEKPLAYDIREGRAMVEAAKKNSGIVQIGFQRRQSPAYQQVAEFIRDGKAGRIVQVDVQIHYRADTPDATPQDPPPSLDWELWCGPAPKLPYSPAIGHKAWRLAEPYGNGHLVDWGIHLMDATRVILQESMPKWVEASGGLYQYKGKITTPDTMAVHFEFERCPVVWRHRLWGAAEYTPETSNGIFFYGEKATVFVTDNRWVVIPNARGAERQSFPVTADTTQKHIENWLEAVRARTQPAVLPADGFCSTATVQLAMISYKTGSRVVWDSKTEQILNNPAAARLLKRDYRAPYRHPYSA